MARCRLPLHVKLVAAKPSLPKHDTEYLQVFPRDQFILLLLGYNNHYSINLTTTANGRYVWLWGSYDWVLGPWRRHQMETFSSLLALCVGNSPVTGEFPSQRPVTLSFGVFCDLRLIYKRLNKYSWGWWFETPSCPLLRALQRCMMTQMSRPSGAAMLTWLWLESLIVKWLNMGVALQPLCSTVVGNPQVSFVVVGYLCSDG